MKKKTLALFGALLVLGMTSPQARASLFLGWADEFVDGTVDCSTSTNNCHIDTFYAQGQPDGPPSWAYIGQQGANATGRSNARGKVMVRFRELDTSGCRMATVSLNRFKVAGIPVEGNGCMTGTQEFVAVSSQTFDTCGLQASDQMINHRLLPVLSFSHEFQTNDIAYRDSINSNVVGMGTGVTVHGCFKIHWF